MVTVKSGESVEMICELRSQVFLHPALPVKECNVASWSATVGPCFHRARSQVKSYFSRGKSN